MTWPHTSPTDGTPQVGLVKKKSQSQALLMDDPLSQTAMSDAKSRRSFFPFAFVAVIFTICLIRLADVTRNSAVDLLFADQWTYLKPLFDGRGPWFCFFSQYGPHRLGLGGVLDWCLYNATGWNACADAWAAVTILALAALATIALAVRLRGSLSWSDAGFPLLLMSPIHWETITFTSMPTPSILPLLLIVLLACSWTATSLAKRVLAVCTFGPLAFFTGYGICAAPVAIGLALLLWLRQRKHETRTERQNSALILFGLCGAAAVFAWGYHWSPGPPGWHLPQPKGWNYPHYCALMFASLLGFSIISPTASIVGAIALILATGTFIISIIKIWKGQDINRAKVVFIFTGTSLVYSALTAIGRLFISIESAFLWRYMTLMTPALCGMAIAAEGWMIPRPKVLRSWVMIGWVVLVGVNWCDFIPDISAIGIAKEKKRWIASYLKTKNLGEAVRESSINPCPYSVATTFIADRLQWLERRHLSFFRESNPDRSSEKNPAEAGKKNVK